MSIFVFKSSNHTQLEYDAKKFPPTRHFTAKIQLAVSGELRTLIYTKNQDLWLMVPQKWGIEIFAGFGLVQPNVDFPADVKGYFECSMDKEGRLVVYAYQRPTAKW